MKNSNYLVGLAALALVGCSDNDFLGSADSGVATSKGNGEITFSTSAPNITRGETLKGKTAAEKLNNNFIVYGFKTSAAEAADASKDEKVFDRYNVNYTDGTANTTESNTSGWEYVGYDSHAGVSQTIKYWDYASTGYVFSAVSGTGITASKITSGTTVYDKGWNVTVPAGGSLSDLYASARLPIAKPTPDGATYDEVTLTFYNLATKIRFAVYEIIPGYSVKIDKFYYNTDFASSSTTNFAINGDFKNINADSETSLKVTYYDESDAAIENRPKVGWEGSAVTESTWGEFGTNIQATSAIGTASNIATYDQNDGEYTSILPFNSTNGMSLKVDYTLTSTDGSGEKIHVKGATAKVPSIYTNWKPNFAYTYIFKISDNTNGTTGTPGTDPVGLYPITFDAEVSTVTDGIQETITSVADPSITTYAKGVIVTANDEYTAGDIYFTNDTKNVAGYKVYEVQNAGTIEKVITEEVVANWQNNFITLTEVTTTHIAVATNIPLSDGTNIATTANQAGYFAAAAGKTYVIASGDANASTTKYKVVKVVGTATAPTYTQSMPTASITATDGKAVYKLLSNSPADEAPVLGAIPNLKIYNGSVDVTGNFTITDKFDGTYEIALTAAAIAAGANGTYTVKFNGTGSNTFTVGLTYALTQAALTITAGNTTGATTVLKVNETATDGDVINSHKDIKVEKTATGTYKVTAAANATPGAKTLTIAGQDLTVNVNTYSFSANNLTITRQLSGDATGTITLNENGAAKSGISLTTSPALAAGTSVAESAGVYTYTVTPTSAGGTYDISYENASATVTVNAYTMEAATGNVARATGSKEITVECNGNAINASTASVTCIAQPGGYSLTANGQKLRFANATVAGDYTFQYKVGAVVVAEITITVE